MAHVYCPECGYNNPEAAHFCAKCGAALVVPEEGESTEAFTAPEPIESLDPLEELGVHGAALIVRSGGGRSGETFPLEASPTTIGRSPDCAIFLDDVTVSRKHAVFSRQGERWVSRPGQPERDVRQPRPGRDDGAQRRRRASDRQVPAHVPPTLMSTTEAPSRRRLLTIGTVCGLLKDEFPDVSISKIRYLDDQGLLTPRRTQAGYRLFSEDDVDRLQTILRLQRDEFLPLRVIREELRRGRARSGADAEASSGRGRRSSISTSSASAPASQPTARASSRTSGCSSRGSRRASASMARATWTSQPPAKPLPAPGSTPGTSAPSARGRIARAGCSRR